MDIKDLIGLLKINQEEVKNSHSSGLTSYAEGKIDGLNIAIREMENEDNKNKKISIEQKYYNYIMDFLNHYDITIETIKNHFNDIDKKINSIKIGDKIYSYSTYPRIIPGIHEYILEEIIDKENDVIKVTWKDSNSTIIMNISNCILESELPKEGEYFVIK